MDLTAEPDTDEIDFHHPYTPYDVQEEFMRAVYDTLEKGNIGILESPTGTGKSLSLICATLTWLRNHKRFQFSSSTAQVAEKYKDEPQWIIDQMLKRSTEDVLRRWEGREQRLEKIRAKEKIQEERSAKRRRLEPSSSLRDGGRAGKQGDEDDEEAEWLLESEQDGKKDDDGLSFLSKETREQMEALGLVGNGKKMFGEEEEDGEEEIKIYYASRTHSQLTQFISELRRPTFPPSIPDSILQQSTTTSSSSPSPKRAKEPIKHIPLSSRQRLCIHPKVSALPTLSAINDRCAELQQGKSSIATASKSKPSSSDPTASKKCPYHPNQVEASVGHTFRDTSLATLPDIEDLHTLGTSLGICPYYALRPALPSAEIITLPYPLLLQASAREALGIKLEGNIVIIDEAHNILDAISSVHAASIKLSDLHRAKQMLSIYVRRFGKKLKGGNRVLVGQVARVVASLIIWMEEEGLGRLGKGKKEGEGVLGDMNGLLKAKGADQINLFELVRYIQSSKLAYKIEGYVSKVESDAKEEEAAKAKAMGKGGRPSFAAKATGAGSGSGGAAGGREGGGGSSASSPVLHTLTSFLLTLTNLTHEGRIFYSIIPPITPSSVPDFKLSYMLLSPTHPFTPFLSCRALLLAGGTMSPMTDYMQHLFPGLSLSSPTATSSTTSALSSSTLPPSSAAVTSTTATTPVTSTAALTPHTNRITTLSCSHVINHATSLRVYSLSSLGSKMPFQSVPFEFSFSKRSDRTMIHQLGVAILNICTAVPDGVVLFFPSYGYLDTVVGIWKEQGGGGRVGGRQGTRGGGGGEMSLWEKLRAKKHIFFESKERGAEETLEGYQTAILDPESLNNPSTTTAGSSSTTPSSSQHKRTASSSTKPASSARTIPSFTSSTSSFSKPTTTSSRSSSNQSFTSKPTPTTAPTGGATEPRVQTTQTGALLLSVISGKMSEGINFSDRLGRCVIIVGLPYPNIASPEWKAKMEYIESSTLASLASSSTAATTNPTTKPGATTAAATTATTTPTGPGTGTGTVTGTGSGSGTGTGSGIGRGTGTVTGAGSGTGSRTGVATPKPVPSPAHLATAKAAARAHYENACMRAVNQSIGRAIRHRGDYAAIVLIDRRYATERIRGKLPEWIRRGFGAGALVTGAGTGTGGAGGNGGGTAVGRPIQEEGFHDIMSSLRRFFQGKKVEEKGPGA